MRKVVCHAYGRPEDPREVEVEDGECPFCQFVSEHVKLVRGGISFVCSEGRIRHVEVLEGPVLALACWEVTVEDVENMLGQARGEMS